MKQKVSDDPDDVYELKFWSPITPSNIGKLAGNFKNAVTNKKRMRSSTECTTESTTESITESATESNGDTNFQRPRKRRKTNHRNARNSNTFDSKENDMTTSNHSNSSNVSTDNDIEITLKPLPPRNRQRSLKKLESVTFSATSFLEDSKSFTFWNEQSIVSTKWIPAKSAKFEPLNLSKIHSDSIYSDSNRNANDLRFGPTPIRITEIPSILISALKETKNIDISADGAGLYRHQTKAVSAICSGFHCIISTATASGKSLCYNLPVLSWICEHPQSRNLYLFPTKALAQDQLRALRLILDAINPKLVAMGREQIRCGTFDGDTVWTERVRVLRECQVILTNLDIVHQTLLPSHALNQRLFASLSFVVLDEAHCYFAVFGSHSANILRRIRRICTLYGATPLFIGCSATIRNPMEHFSSLTGISSDGIRLVDHEDDGSASGRKLVVFWQSPLRRHSASKSTKKKSSKRKKSGKTKRVKSGKKHRHFRIAQHLKTMKAAKSMSTMSAMKTSSARTSPFVEAAMLFSQCILSRIRCILFVRQRSVCELIYKYSRDLLMASDAPDSVHSVSSYRGGYRKALRREIEANLFNDQLIGLVSTNAMELGVDIGDLDCTLHAGYSGLASLWQQIGRAGRGNNGDTASMAIFVATNSVIDEYIVNHSHFVFDSKLENTVIYPFNRRIWSQHLLSSIADEPMDRTEIESIWSNPDDPEHSKIIESILNELAENEQITFNEKMAKWVLSPKYRAILALKCHQNERVNYGHSSHRIHPAKWIGIRSIDPITFSVLTEDTDTANAKLDEVERRNVFFHFFPGAIYLHRGREYEVTTLDLTNHRAICHEVRDCEYFTKSRDRTDILIANRLFTAESIELLHFGEVEIRTVVFGFFKISKRTTQIIEEKELKLPTLCTKTVAFWLDIPDEITKQFAKRKLDIISAIHSAEHCIIGLLPLFTKCDANHFDTECPSEFDSKKRIPRIIVTESTEGGLGFLEDIAVKRTECVVELIDKALQRLTNCSCSKNDGDGCLRCCHSTRCHEYNIVSSRKGAVVLLQLLQSFLKNNKRK